MPDKLINKAEKDIRLKATIWIWSSSIPIFLICLPIIALSETGIIVPCFVLCSAVIATASVWFFYSKPVNLIYFEVKQLQDRVANLETIAGHEQLEEKFKISQGD